MRAMQPTNKNQVPEMVTDVTGVSDATTRTVMGHHARANEHVPLTEEPRDGKCGEG